MKIVTTFVLAGIAAGMAGCNSHASSEGQNGNRAINNRADVGRGGVNAAPVVNQAADKAIDTIESAAATANQVTADVNHTAVKAQVEAQQVTNDASRLTNDAARATNGVLNTAAHDANSATRDLNQLQNAFR
jgi:hypothetical protein